MTQTARIAQKYLASSAADRPDLTVSPIGLLTLAKFYATYAAYRQATAEQGSPNPALTRSGSELAKRFLPTVIAALDTYFVPRTKELQIKGNLVQTRKGKGPALYVNIGKGLSVLFGKARKKRALPEMLGAKLEKRGIDLTKALTPKEPLSRINAIVSVPGHAAKGMAALLAWVKKVAKVLGVEPTKIEQTITAASTVKEIGKELREINGKISLAETGSAEQADLNEQRLDLLDQVEETADASPHPEAVTAAAVVETIKDDEYTQITDMGRQLDMSEEQEAAMMIQGKGLIAAGAGSGKTRVLAGKVVDTIKRLGARSNQIIATSFSKKSAAELIKRIKDYGGEDILTGGTQGFGTTHSIGKALQKEFIQDREVLGGKGESSLLKMAMAQVRMMPNQGVRDPAPKDMFEGLFDAAEAARVKTEPLEAESIEEEPFEEEPEVTPEVRRYRDTIQAMAGLAEWGAGRNYSWGPRDLRIIDPILSAHRAQEDLTSREKAALNKLLDIKDYKSGGPGRYQRALTRNGIDPNYRIASARTAARGSEGPIVDKNYYWNEPANQYFNLGIQKFEDEKGLAIGSKRFGTAISKYRAHLISPSIAWKQDGGSPEKGSFAAVYGAYDWLKRNDPKISGKMDFGDMLEDACKLLVSNPKALASVQARFNHILVDEAQDLNAMQHLLFGLIAGYVDPETRKPYGDGRMTAEDFVFIGDDKQCCAEGSMVDTPDGQVPIEQLAPGSSVISYRNGVLKAQKVRHCIKSGWDWGYKVTTESGHSLTMSPNHKLWATEPRTEEGQVTVYLMYRKDMGFRVGTTNKGKVGSEGDYLASYGGRCFQEKADRLWIVNICKNLDKALLQEQVLSLHYGIPTQVFNGEHRGLSQSRLNAIFEQFGCNGTKLLEDRNLSFNLPHWMAQSYTKHGRDRSTINLTAHGSSNTHVSLEWTGDKWDDVLSGRGINKTADNRRRLRRWFVNYREALAYAEQVAETTEAQISQRLSIPDGAPLRKITAAGLFTGMQLPAREEHTIALDRIVSIEKVEGVAFYDLDVDDASNFLAEGLLTHNSIYEFRGAEPEEFIDKSELGGGAGEFKTQIIERNWRSGKNIVDAANRLIAHNSKQIPMVCTTNPIKGDGAIFETRVSTHQAGAALAANEIEQLTQGEAGMMTYDQFGIAVRTNAEAYAFGVEMIKRGIPFRCKVNFFTDFTTTAVITWLSLASADPSDKKTVNPLVLAAHKAPKFNLNIQFERNLQRQARGQNYLTFLHDGGWSDIYPPIRDKRTGRLKPNWRNKRNVKPYTEALWEMANSNGSPSEMLDQVLHMEGTAFGDQAATLEAALIEGVRGSPDMIDLLSNEAEDGVITEDAIRGLALAPIEPLMGLIESYEDLGPALDYIHKLQRAADKQAKEDNPDKADYREPAVNINTVHTWKGLEVNNLYVPMAAGVFPHSLSEEDPEQMASERRLAYVALTRGKDSVTVISPDKTHTGKPGGTSVFVTEACIKRIGVEDDPDTPAPPRTAAYEREAFLEAFIQGDFDEEGQTQVEEAELIQAWGGEL